MLPFYFAGSDEDEEFWKIIKVSDEISDFEKYLSKYPKGRFVEHAKAKINILKKGQAPKPAPGPEPVPVKKEPEKPAVVESVRIEQPKPPAEMGIWKEPNTGMEFVYVKGGEFEMGDTFGDGGSDEKSVHKVKVDNFWMGKYEVTVGQYMQFAKETNTYPEWLEQGSSYNIKTGSDDYYKKFGDALTSKNYLIVGVSWNNAVAYAKWLSGKSGYEIRLPSEAEWEYTCRSGGKKEKYSGTDDINKAAWYSSNSGGKTHEVGTKDSNGLHIYDMSGNVWEWCLDIYDAEAYT